MPRLRRADCSEPGINRVRRGRGFDYVREDGSRVLSKPLRKRIAELAVPPAWTNVWICPDAQGHIQATGIDAKGRKQYLYHEQWNRQRARKKFDEMLDFARALPRLRKRAEMDMRRKELDRDKVLGCAARLLDLGFFRIGGERYAEENETYGLATLRKKHVTVNGSAVTFDYAAKGGERRAQTVIDEDVLPVIRSLKRRRSGGRELLAYREGRTWLDVRAEDINEYVREAAEGDFSAKDFRTWNATVLAAVQLAAHDPKGMSKARRARAAREAAKSVAEYLGNTPAVCRSAYIDPRVFDRFDSGETIAPALKRIAADSESFADRVKIERAVIRLLD